MRVQYNIYSVSIQYLSVIIVSVCITRAGKMYVMYMIYIEKTKQ